MTRYDAIRRQLGDIEKDHERALALREMQLRVISAYRDELEDHVDIAAGMLAVAKGCSKDKALALIAGQYETRQARKAVTEESVSSEHLTGDALANAALDHIVSVYGLRQPQEDAT